MLVGVIISVGLPFELFHQLCGYFDYNWLILLYWLTDWKLGAWDLSCYCQIPELLLLELLASWGFCYDFGW